MLTFSTFVAGKAAEFSNPRLVRNALGDGNALPADTSSLRLWTKAGNVLRDGNPVGDDTNGDFIEANDVYTATDLGFSDSTRQITLYVEAVRPSTTPGDLQVAVKMTYAPLGMAQTTAARFTAVKAQAFYYGSSANVLLGDASGSDGGDPMSNTFLNGVNLADGTVSTPAVTDLASDGFGQDFGMTRVWTDRLVNQLSPGFVGNGWVISDLPTLVNATSTVIANIDGNSSLYFDLADGTYEARFFSNETLVKSGSGSNEQYILTDTVGDKIVFFGFDSSINIHERGRIKGFEDGAGNVITFTWDNSKGQLQTVTRTDGTITETWAFTYNPTTNTSTDLMDAGKNPSEDSNDATPYQLNKLTLSRSGVVNPGLVEQVAFVYYPRGAPNGGLNDLESAILGDANGNVLSAYYYRYDASPGVVKYSGIDHLTLVISPTDLARTTLVNIAGGIDNASNNSLRPFAQFYFTYAEAIILTQDIIGQGTSDRDDGNTSGRYSYAFSNSTNGGVGSNVWHTKVEVTTPLDSTEDFYTNFAGEVMGSSLENEQADNVYDSVGRIRLTAMPSAVVNFDPASPSLIGRTASGVCLLLHTNAGLVVRNTYVQESSAHGYLQTVEDLHGGAALLAANASTANDVPVSSFTYTAQTVGADTVYLVDSSTVYGNVNYGDPRTTGFAYVFPSNWLTPSEMTTTPPSNTTGDSATGPTTIWYDDYGRVQWTKDALGYLNFTDYDNATGAVTEMIVDSTSPSGTPLALTTSTVVDNLGRPTSVTDPNNLTTTYTYPVDDESDLEVVVTPPAVNSGPSAPSQVTDYNYAAGTEDIKTTNGGGTQSLTQEVLDNAGRLIESDRYYQVGQFYATTYTYDDGGRQSDVIDPLGTITTTDYDDFGRVIDKRIGGTVIETDTYDGGQSGDGNLTSVTDLPGWGSQNLLEPNRVATNYYDWRDRLIASSNGVALTYDTLNNLGEVTQAEVYAASGAGLPFFGPDGLYEGNPTVPPNSAALVQRTQYAYDKEDRLYQTSQVAVNPNTGAVGGPTISITSTTYYDADGQVIATSSPTGLWTKTAYDGAGRVTATYATDGAGGETEVQSAALFGNSGEALVQQDHVFSQQEFTYDSDGDTTLTITRDRLEGDSSTALGQLGDASGSGGPAARVTSVKDVYDADDRLTKTENFGTYAVSASLTNALVTSNTYDGAGRVDSITDPQNIVTHREYDMLGRVTMEIDNYDTDADSTPDTNKTTGYIYNGDDEVTLTTVYNIVAGVSTPAPQTITNEYGTTGSLDRSKLSVVTYADGTKQSYWYDWLGDKVFMQNRDGTQHHYEYDAVGRQISDYANHFGAGVDTTVQALTTSYDVLNRPVFMSSDGIVSTTSGGVTTNAWGIVNQVQNVYDSFGNLAIQYQEAHGSVTYDVLNSDGSIQTHGSNKVQYIYDTDHPTQLQRLVYPDGRVEWYAYSGLDANISRVTSVNDGTTNDDGQSIEEYSYLGLGTVVGKTRDQNGTAESIDLDAYGRVDGVSWTQASNDDLESDSFTYGYGADGELQYTLNNLDADMSESYTYDGLNRELTFKRGTLDGSHVSDGSQTDATWTVDAVGNKYGGGRYATSYSNTNIDLATDYTKVGDQKTVALPAGTIAATYDAWGRLVTAKGQWNDTANTVKTSYTFTYDATGRVIKEADSVSGVTTFSLYSGTNVIENRDSAGYVVSQNVWSAAGPSAIILRDRDSDGNSSTYDSHIPLVSGVGLDERIYAQTDGLGNTTSLADLSGNVLEREQYDQDGQPTSINADWTSATVTATYDGDGHFVPPTTAPGQSQYQFAYLYHGGHYYNFLPNQLTTQFVNGVHIVAISSPGGGMYSFGGGRSWYDSYHGLNVQPDYTTYSPGWEPSDDSTTDGPSNQYISDDDLPDWTDYLDDALDQSFDARMSFIGNGIKQFAYQILDINNDFSYLQYSAIDDLLGTDLASNLTYHGYLSDMGRGIDSGAIDPDSDQYQNQAIYGAGNAMTLGLLDEGVATYQGLAGQISCDEWGNRVAAAGFSQILAGMTIPEGANLLLNRTPGCILTQAFEGAGEICFVAGTQVGVGVRGEDGSDSLPWLKLPRDWSPIAAATILRYITVSIECVKVGSWVLARDQNNPYEPLVLCRVTRTYVRIAYHLQLVSLRDEEGREQMLQTTDKHRFYSVVGGLWKNAEDLTLGETVISPSGVLSVVIGNVREEHPEGVKVYNFEVEGAHTYFVRAEGSDAEPVWVHNAELYSTIGLNDPLPDALQYGRELAKDSVQPRELGNEVHYDRYNGSVGDQLPSALQEEFSETEFEFARRGEAGPDVKVVGGPHPSAYPDSFWDPGCIYGDFKPDTASGWERLANEGIRGKVPGNTQMIPYNPITGRPAW